MTGASPTISRIFTASSGGSHQRHGAGFCIAGGAAQARKQLAPATVLVARVIESRQFSLTPDVLRNLRLEHALVAIEENHVAVAHFAERPAAESFRGHVNGGRHAA